MEQTQKKKGFRLPIYLFYCWFAIQSQIELNDTEMLTVLGYKGTVAPVSSSQACQIVSAQQENV